MRRRKLDKAYAEGVSEGMKCAAPNPIRMDRHIRMAYDAGWAEGRRERARCEKFIRETCRAPNKESK